MRNPGEYVPSAPVPGEPVTQPPAASRKPWLAVAAVLAVLLFCCCGAVLSLVAYGIIAEPETLIEEIGTAVVGEQAPAPGGDALISSRDFSVEVQRATERFYPGYTAETFAILEGSDDLNARLHVIAFPSGDGTRILFAIERTGEVRTDPGIPETQYLDPESGALWTHDTGPSGLQAWAGPDSFAPHDQVGAALAQAHGDLGLLITDYGMISNVQVRLSGIREIELDGWDGTSTTWESVWDLDIANSRWVESSFSP
jgi:hypothetical protein